MGRGRAGCSSSARSDLVSDQRFVPDELVKVSPLTEQWPVPEAHFLQHLLKVCRSTSWRVCEEP